jgi:transcriptional regulator with XRE-family HTH domain
MFRSFGPGENAEMSGAEVKRVRESFGYTQEQLAEIFGVHKATISRWEHMDTLPLLETWAIIGWMRSELTHRQQQNADIA